MSTSLKAPEPAALPPSSMLQSIEDSCQPITLAVSHRKAALQYDSTPSSSTGNSETSSACKPAAHEHKGAPVKQHSESSSTTSSTSVTLQLSRSGAANNPKAFSKCWPEYRIVRGRQVLVMCGCEVVVWACVVLILLILGLAVGLPVGLVLSSAKDKTHVRFIQQAAPPSPPTRPPPLPRTLPLATSRSIPGAVSIGPAPKRSPTASASSDTGAKSSSGAGPLSQSGQQLPSLPASKGSGSREAGDEEAEWPDQPEDENTEGPAPPPFLSGSAIEAPPAAAPVPAQLPWSAAGSPQLTAEAGDALGPGAVAGAGAGSPTTTPLSSSPAADPAVAKPGPASVRGRRAPGTSPPGSETSSAGSSGTVASSPRPKPPGKLPGKRGMPSTLTPN